MAKNDNLTDFVIDIAKALRQKKGKSDLINPQNFYDEIMSIEAGGGEIPKYMSATNFTFEGNNCTGFVGDNSFDTYILPRTYSLDSDGNVIDGVDYEITGIEQKSSRQSGFTNLTKNLVLLDNIINIGGYSFYNCSSLKGIIISSSVENIGEMAFYYCRNLQSITIPSSVRNIGISAFADCYGLNNIIIPSSITNIARTVFASCKGLTSITIPQGVTDIENEAFHSCNGLTSITIPSSVRHIDYGVFKFCDNLTEMILKPTTPPFIYTNTISTSTKKIYIPVGTLSAYQSATNWAEFAGKFVEMSDITDTTAEADYVELCSIFYDANGVRQEGRMPTKRATIDNFKVDDATQTITAWQGDATSSDLFIMPATYSLSEVSVEIKGLPIKGDSDTKWNKTNTTTKVNSIEVSNLDGSDIRAFTTSGTMISGYKISGFNYPNGCLLRKATLSSVSALSVLSNVFAPELNPLSVPYYYIKSNADNGTLYKTQSDFENALSANAKGTDLTFYSDDPLGNMEIVDGTDKKVLTVGGTFTSGFGSGATTIKKLIVQHGIKEYNSSSVNLPGYNNLVINSLILPSSIIKIGNLYIGTLSVTSILNAEELTLLATTPPVLDSVSIQANVIYIPKGTLQAYQTATNWSQYADKFVEMD